MLILKIESYSAVCLCYPKMFALLTKKICKEGFCGTDKTTTCFRYRMMKYEKASTEPNDFCSV